MKLRNISLLACLVACKPPAADRIFATDVAPILERSCAASTCHGVAPDSEARGEVVDWDQFHFRVDDAGQLMHLESARQAALGAVNTVEDPAFSTLLLKPLAESWGGLPHFGRGNFTTSEDADYRAIHRWIAEESKGGEDPEPLDADDRWFADHVQPVLTSLMCSNGNCHGGSSGVPMHFEPGFQGEISAAGIRANRRAALGQIHLDGDALASRLLRKALPLHAGGIVHRGGNDNFLLGLDDPRLATLEEWICRETGCPDPQLRGLVFVRGPVEEGDFFDVDTWNPGTDLHFASIEGDDAANAVNLTEHLHVLPADIRDPAVSPDGERVAFAMRTDPGAGHNLWELELESGDARRLTSDAGALPGGGIRTYRDPSYGPDGQLYFVSTAAGVLADHGERLDTDVYALDLASGAVLRRTHTPHIERKVVYFRKGAEIAFTALRDLIPDQARAHPFRFPPGLQTEYHQHFGVTAEETLTWDMRELADGRFVAVLADLESVGGGRLAIVDRNFGPAISVDAPSADPSLPNFTPPLVRLDADALYRDPAPLPDGRVLVSVGSDVDDLAIRILTLDEAVDRSGPRVASYQTLVDEPGVSDFDPEPVYVRHLPVDLEPWAWDPEASTGRLHHQGMQTIDALLTNLSPSGLKEPSATFSAVRLIEALPLLPSEWDHVTLTRQGPARILAELPLAADGTFQAVLPAGVAFRIQGLDDRGVAVGTPHNRWFDVNPGQVIPQGVQPAHYGTLCAACHGAADGDPDHVFVEPDLLTTASLTLSRFENQDPRQPIAAPILGADTVLEVDFQRDIHPIVRGSCAHCHGGAQPAGGVALTAEPTAHYSVAYESLVEGAWVDAETGSAARSPLTDVLFEDHPGRSLTDEEVLTFVRWMDLGAAWIGGRP